MFCICIIQNKDGEPLKKKCVFLVSRDGCVALPRGAVGLPAVCDCGIA